MKFGEDPSVSTFFTTPKKRIGSKSGYGSVDVWSTVDRVIHRIKQFQSTYYRLKDPIPVGEFEGKLGKEDCLFIIEETHHCHVILYLAQPDFCFISDDRNKFESDEDTQDCLGKMLGYPEIYTIIYNNSYHNDVCAVSGILIGYELLRLYYQYGTSINNYSSLINVPGKLRARLIRQEIEDKKMLPLPDVSSNISKRVNLKCEL